MTHKTLILSALFLFTAQAACAQTLSEESSGVFTGKDASSLIAAELVKAGAGDDIQVSIQQARDDMVLATSNGMITADTDGLTMDRARGSWQAVLLIKADGRNLAPIKLSGRFDEMTQVPVLKVRVQAPEIIHEEDVVMDREPLSHLRKNIILNIDDLVGKSPRHLISPGRPIRSEEVAGPQLVGKGSQVTMLYRTRNLEIKTFGEALESGAKGDVIRVKNQASKAVIEGTVDSLGHVTVSSPDSDSAEAM